MKPRRDLDGLDFHRWYAQRQRAQQERAFNMVANSFAIVFADLSSNYSTCTLVTLSEKSRLVTLLEENMLTCYAASVLRALVGPSIGTDSVVKSLIVHKGEVLAFVYNFTLF